MTIGKHNIHLALHGRVTNRHVLAGGRRAGRASRRPFYQYAPAHVKPPNPLKTQGAVSDATNAGTA